MLNGEPYNYPGSIVTVIDESNGGDAIVAYKDKISSLSELKNHTNLKVAFTPDSPSAHLLKSVSVHFDIPHLLTKSADWMLTTDGSSGALEALKNRQAAVAVLWEPDVSRALKMPETIKLLGTENTSRLIVDILIASRQTLSDHPEKVQVLLASYFRGLKIYRQNRDLLQAEIREAHNLKDSEITTMLEGVEWKNLTDNALKWFGISQGGELGYEGLIDSIDAALTILKQSKDISGNPLPNKDPYRLLNRQFVEELYAQFSKGQFGFSAKVANPANGFKALSIAEWDSLKEIGTLRIRPITFQSGTANLNTPGKLELDTLATQIQHYPNFRILVRGHTGVSGDKNANTKLSQDRADSVSRYLQITHSLDENRIRSIGLGGEQPLARKQGESLRTYKYRLPRVEITLLGESF